MSTSSARDFTSCIVHIFALNNLYLIEMIDFLVSECFLYHDNDLRGNIPIPSSPYCPSSYHISLYHIRPRELSLYYIRPLGLFFRLISPLCAAVAVAGGQWAVSVSCFGG